MESSFDLFIQTALPEAQVALLTKGKILASSSWEKLGSHSEILPVRLQSLLTDTKQSLNQCRRILCVNGPGSFTGLRVGVSFTRALAQSLQIGVVPISTLDLLCYSAKRTALPRLAIVDAQKNSLFIQVIRILSGGMVKIEQPEQILAIQDLETLLKEPHQVCGKDLLRYQSLLSKQALHNLHLPSEDENSINLEVALPLLLQGLPPEGSWETLLPRYLKKSAPEELRESTPSS